MKETQLAKFVRKFGKQTLGVLGDFMLDEVLSGEATRISPEAPVPVVRMGAHPGSQISPGGAGLAAASVQALGGRAIPFGAIGTDETGRELLKELRKHRIPGGSLVRERERTTPRKVRIAARRRQLLRLDFEKPAPVSSRTAAQVVKSFARWAPKLNGLVISDYGKGSVSTELCGQVTAMARQRRIPVLAAPKPDHPEICRHSTAALVHLQDAELMAGRPMRGRSSLEAVGRQLLAVLDSSYLLILRDSEGMALFERDGTVQQIAGIARPASEAIGIRETVLAVLALALASGAEIKEAAELATLAAGRAALCFGASAISPTELLKAIAGGA